MGRGALHIAALAACALVLAGAGPADDEKPPAEQKRSRKTRVRLGGVSVGAGYAHYSGAPYFWRPYYWHPASYSLYDPWFWYNPCYPAAFYRSFEPGAGKGEIRLETTAKSAEVYIDDAYAGLAGERKTMWLEPGAYNISLRMEGREPFEKRVYVLSGKRLRLDAKLAEREDKP